MNSTFVFTRCHSNLMKHTTSKLEYLYDASPTTLVGKLVYTTEKREAGRIVNGRETARREVEVWTRMKNYPVVPT